MCMVDHYSISSLLLHKRNPRKWVLSYLEGLKDPGSAATEFGSKLHEYLECRMQEKETEKLDEVSEKSVEGWLEEWDILKGQAKWNIETKFSSQLVDNLPPIIGFIDLWSDDFYADKLLVIDHKTCNPRFMENEDSIKKNWQLGLYSYVLGKGEKDSEIRHNQFIKNREGQIVSFKFVKNLLTQKEQYDMIIDIKQEMYSAAETESLYREKGLFAIRFTPENKIWYGKLCSHWTIINEEETVEEYKKRHGKL